MYISNGMVNTINVIDKKQKDKTKQNRCQTVKKNVFIKQNKLTATKINK